MFQRKKILLWSRQSLIHKLTLAQHYLSSWRVKSSEKTAILPGKLIEIGYNIFCTICRANQFCVELHWSCSTRNNSYRWESDFNGFTVANARQLYSRREYMTDLLGIRPLTTLNSLKQTRNVVGNFYRQKSFETIKTRCIWKPRVSNHFKNTIFNEHFYSWGKHGVACTARMSKYSLVIKSQN